MRYIYNEIGTDEWKAIVASTDKNVLESTGDVAIYRKGIHTFGLYGIGYNVSYDVLTSISSTNLLVVFVNLLLMLNLPMHDLKVKLTRI